MHRLIDTCASPLYERAQTPGCHMQAVGFRLYSPAGAGVRVYRSLDCACVRMPNAGCPPADTMLDCQICLQVCLHLSHLLT